MCHELNRNIALSIVLGTLLIMPIAVNAESGGHSQGHREVTGVDGDPVLRALRRMHLGA